MLFLRPKALQSRKAFVCGSFFVQFCAVYEIQISTHLRCNRKLQNGNRNFFGQLKTHFAADIFVEKSVENVKNP
jgi:hypothetical protein